MTRLNVYLTFYGDAEAALNHYAAALKGTVALLQRFKDAPAAMAGADPQAVMHGEVHAGDIVIMASDGVSGKRDGGNVIELALQLDDADEQARIFKALAAGGEVTMPLEKQFWGARFGKVTDRFGVRWMLNCDK